MHPTNAVLARMAAQALTLYERSERSDLTLCATAPGTLQRRRDAWRDNCARGDEQAFLRRLREDGITPEAAGQLLHDVQFSGAVALPAWSGFLCAALAASAHWTEATVFQPCPDSEEFAYYPLLRPFIEYACQQLDAQLLALDLHVDAAALTRVRTHLVRQLASQAAFTFHLEFTLFKAARESSLAALLRRAAGAHSQRWYQAFVMDFHRRRWWDFFAEYAVLARQIGCVAMNWIDANVEMLTRLAADRQLLSRHFGNGAALGALQAIDTGASDAHNAGRTSAILTFGCGTKIVYKPKPLATDLLMGELVAWINRHDSLLDLQSVATQDCGRYGWQACVVHAPCRDEAAVQRFYRRSGYQLALIYVLEGYDCHYENIIAAGEYPCLIDTETIFNPYKEMVAVTLGQANAATLASKEVFYSVMRTGMLPNWSVHQGGQKRDTSGFGGSADGVGGKLARSVWVAPNSDDMRLEMVTTDLVPMANLPYITAGVPALADAHVSDIAHGFGAMYQFLTLHRHAFIDLIRQRQISSVRFVRRATNLYAQQMWTLSNAHFLRDGLDWSIEVEKMGHALLAGQGTNHALWRLLREEARAMMARDVPYFNVRTDSLDVVNHDGAVVVPDYFSIPCFERVVQKLDQLNAADQALQQRYIAYSFYARAAKSYHEADPFDAAQPVEKKATHQLAPVDAQACIGVAEDIARELIAEAVHAPDGSMAWIALEYLSEGDTFQFKPVSYNFYSGVIGIAFFLAATGKVTGKAEYRLAAESAMRPVLTIMKQELDIVLAFGGLGAGVGIGSLFYALAAISAFDPDSAFSKQTLLIALGCLEKIDAALLAKDSKLDVIFGTAGLVLGLVKLYRATGAPAVLAKIALAADHLLDRRVPGAGGVLLVPTVQNQVVSGISHGIAGIALALMRAYRETGDLRYRHAAMDHVAHEEASYDAGAGNYPDYRSRPGRPAFMTCWCHGAPGIGLSRLAMHQITGAEALVPQIEKNIAQTSRYPLEHLDHICCGNMGRLDIQLAYARHAGDQDLLQRVRQDAAYVVARYRRDGGFRLFVNAPNKVFSPGLFVGATGIAYTLLRLADPTGLPCVLAFE